MRWRSSSSAATPAGNDRFSTAPGRHPGKTKESTMSAHNTAEAAQPREAEREAIERDIITEAAKRVWNEPDPRFVKLQDGRQVLREFYDPAIHGASAE
jgi:hypothetical protein